MTEPAQALPDTDPARPRAGVGAGLPAVLQTALPRGLRGRLAVLGLLGAGMAGLPLAQLLLYQSAELDVLALQRAGLDPVARTVDVQRGLLAHRDLASLVLRGRSAMEAERKARQNEVDERVAELHRSLTSGAWERAAVEAEALREDWSVLVGQVLVRSIDAGESDQAHRLLVEQVLQVNDLLGMAMGAPPRSARATADAAFALDAAHALPRLAGQIAALAYPSADRDREGGAAPRDLVAAEASLARTLGALDAALERRSRAGRAAATPAGRALAEARAAAGAAAEHYFHLLRHGAAAPSGAATQAAGMAALRTQFHLFDMAVASAADALAVQESGTRQQRLWSLVAVATLAALALALLLQIRRSLQPGPGAPPAESSATLPPSRHAGREATGLLMRRLREGEPPAAGAPAAPPVPEHQPTLPPQG